jgi:hypothetical protein
VKSLYLRLLKKANRTLKAFKHGSNKNKSFQEIQKMMNLSLCSSKWLESTIKMAMLTGYKIVEDPIFSSLLYTMSLSAYMNLKKKARIMVENSCVVIGVVDESGLLEENEIFLQLRRDNFSKKS